MSRMHEIASAAIASRDYESVARTYFVTPRTVEAYVKRLGSGKLTPHPKSSAARLSPRRKAIKMALAGASTGAICAALGLKRTTARVYRWEAHQIAKHELKLDPLLL